MNKDNYRLPSAPQIGRISESDGGTHQQAENIPSLNKSELLLQEVIPTLVEIGGVSGQNN